MIPLLSIFWGWRELLYVKRTLKFDMISAGVRKTAFIGLVLLPIYSLVQVCLINPVLHHASISIFIKLFKFFLYMIHELLVFALKCSLIPNCVFEKIYFNWWWHDGIKPPNDMIIWGLIKWQPDLLRVLWRWSIPCGDYPAKGAYLGEHWWSGEAIYSRLPLS